MFHTNVLNDIVQYAIGTSGGWHMDIFAIVCFMFNIFIQGGVLLYCANECLKKILNYILPTPSTGGGEKSFFCALFLFNYKKAGEI
jgi:hypothetical protein